MELTSYQIQVYLIENNCYCTINKFAGNWYALNYFNVYHKICRTLYQLSLEEWLKSCQKIEFAHPDWHEKSEFYNILKENLCFQREEATIDEIIQINKLIKKLKKSNERFKQYKVIGS